MTTGRGLVDERRLIGLFLDLVRTDSESTEERRICDVLARTFRELGLDVEEDDIGARIGHSAGNLYAWLDASPGLEDVPPIFFTCHMDTVKPGKGVRPRLDEDGYFRSDGTTILGSDDKAGIAALLEGVRTVLERGIPHGPVQFILTVGEELGLKGSRLLDRRRVRGRFGYALDSGGPVGEIVTAAPSQAKITAVIRGKSAHAGVSPEEGISAIQVASRAIASMPLGRIDRETTANIGSFQGGTHAHTNIVCELVTITAEARSLDPAKLERQVAAMRGAFESAAGQFGAVVEFESEIMYPAYRISDGEPVVRLAAEAFREIGIEPRTVSSGGGSDANHFNGKGFPTVNLAVGYEHIHTTRERMPVGELLKAAEAVAAIIRRAAARPDILRP